RLNINTVSADQLSFIDAMTPDVAAAIIDWRDADNAVTPGGAEQDYYLSLQPPYLPRNGPIQTIRELLMVRGISRQLLFGSDVHANGLLGSGGPEGDGVDASDQGWAGLLTVNSGVDNVSATGTERVNVQTADESSLTRIRGITADIARSIVAWRGQH